jgi:hypothetical protein
MISFESPSRRAEPNDDNAAAMAWLTQHLLWERRLADLRRGSTPDVAAPSPRTRPVRRRLSDLTPTESGSVIKRRLGAEPPSASSPDGPGRQVVAQN